MTKPNQPTPRTGDDRLARDVAKHLDRRNTRRKLGRWTAILAILVVAALYLRFGSGLGLGLGGLGKGGGPGSAHTLVGSHRCAIRVAASGITVDGKPMQRDDAVDACKATAGADIVVTGDARQGDQDALLDALKAADVPAFLRNQPPAGSASK